MDQVRIGVRSGDDGSERDVILSPMSTPTLNNLKYLDWELECRRRVEELGQGKIGYVHLRAMGGENYTEFAQGYFPVWDRAGLIIDVRHNRYVYVSNVFVGWITYIWSLLSTQGRQHRQLGTGEAVASSLVL